MLEVPQRALRRLSVGWNIVLLRIYPNPKHKCLKLSDYMLSNLAIILYFLPAWAHTGLAGEYFAFYGAGSTFRP